MEKRKKATEGNVTGKGSDYLCLGLYAFAGLGMEALYAYLLEPALYGASMSEWTERQTIFHWIITCITWGIFAYVLVKKAEEKYHFPILEKGTPMKLWQWAAGLLFVFLAFLVDYKTWGGFKVYLEFVRRGGVLFLFQYIYYAFETLLFLLIIVFGQRACEVWLHREKIPYGGMICGLTWGLAHMFTKDILTGIFGLMLGFAMGYVYLLANRDLKRAYVLLFLMFVL